jgi:hypothetical protein
MALRPSHVIAASDTPLAALLQEIKDLDAACSNPPSADQGGADATLAALREALTVQGKTVSHEVARFALVISPDATLPGIRAVAGSFADALAMLVSVAQVLVATSVRTASRLNGGHLFHKDVRNGARAVLRASAAFVDVATRRATSNGVRIAAEFRTAAGMVLEACDALAKVPASPQSASRRVLLSLARVLRESAREIREQHTESNASYASIASLIDACVGVLKHSSALVKHALQVCDAAATATGSAADAATATTSEGADTATVDAVCEAITELDDAVVDFAAAANDVGEGEGDEDDLDEEDEEEEEEEEKEATASGGAGVGSAAADIPGAAAVAESLPALRAALARVASASTSLARRLAAEGVGASASASNGEGDSSAGGASTLIAQLQEAEKEAQAQIAAAEGFTKQ